MKEQALARTSPPQGKVDLYHPGDQLMTFLAIL
jgi:hypothetical protein